MTYYGISKLPELDKIIIIYTDIEDLLQLLSVNSFIKNLIIELIPCIVDKYYNDDYDDEYDLYYFGLNLISSRKFDVFSQLKTIYDNFKNPKINKFYTLLGELIISEHLDDFQLMKNYFDIVPDNYEWKDFIEMLCNHYYISYFNEDECLEHFESLNLLIKASKYLNNYDFYYILYDINNSYKLHIEDHENSHNVICTSVKEMILKNDILIESSKFYKELIL